VANVARYDPQDAAEALLSQDLERYVRVIAGLRGEGEQPTFVLFVISNALFVLQSALRSGSLEAAFSEHRYFNKTMQRAVQAAAKRFTREQIDAAIAQASAIDRAIKGVGSGEAWQSFVALGLKLARGSKG
jgi:DNA polymerase-3 subunit delta